MNSHAFAKSDNQTTGTPAAKQECLQGNTTMAERKKVDIVRPIHGPDIELKHPLDDEWKLKVAERDIEYLKLEVRRLEELIYYKNLAIEDSIKTLQEILEQGEPLAITAVRRWISRLVGALRKFEKSPE